MLMWPRRELGRTPSARAWLEAIWVKSRAEPFSVARALFLTQNPMLRLITLALLVAVFGSFIVKLTAAAEASEATAATASSERYLAAGKRTDYPLRPRFIAVK